MHICTYSMCMHTKETNTCTEVLMEGMKMSKSGFNVYVPTDLKERFKREFDNPSKEIREFMEARLGTSDNSINNRIEELEEEIEEEKGSLNTKKSRIESMEAELKVLKNEKKKKEQTTDEEERFLRLFRERDWRKPSDIKPYWPQELNMTREELYDLGKNSQEK